MPNDPKYRSRKGAGTDAGEGKGVAVIEVEVLL